MLVGSWADLFTPKSLPNNLLRFAGNSDVALLIAVLVSFFTFGKLQGFNRDQIQKFCGECLAPIAGITLIVGAGGGFGGVLRDSGISQQIVETAKHAHLSPLLLGWFVAALMRLRRAGDGRDDDGCRHRRRSRRRPVRRSARNCWCSPPAQPLIFSHERRRLLADQGVLRDDGRSDVQDLSLLETIISVLGLGFTLLLSMVL